MVLSVRRSFHGFIGFLVFCWSVATPCISFATEVGYPTTDVWIPLDEAYPYVEDLYTTYNGALSEGSGVTVTADNYDELVARSIIGNWVATNMAFGEDVSLDGIMDVIEADADYFQYLIHSIEVNPLNGAYRIGQSVGAHARAYISNMLSSVFGLEDIMTTSEAVGHDFPEGRVFVKLVPSDDPITVGNWLYVPYGDSTAPLNPSLYNASYSDGYYHLSTNVPNGVYITQVGTSGTYFYVATKETSAPSSDTMFLRIGYYTYYNQSTWNTFIGSYVGVYPVGNYIYRSARFSNSSALGTHMKDCLHYIGCYGYTDLDVAIADLYGGTPSGGDTYTDPIVVINDNDTPIISPTSVYNNWQTISNNNYNNFTTNYVTYDMGDSIYNYTYNYSINNYNTDTPLWVINGDNIPIYDYDVPTLVDVDSLEFETRSVDINSNFYQDVYEGLPSKVSVLVITMGFGVLAVALLKK